MDRLLHSSSKNPCPVCNGMNAACKSREAFVLCMTEADSAKFEIVNGWKNVGLSKGWAQFVPADQQGRDPIVAKSQTEAKAERESLYRTGLNPAERNAAHTQLLAQLPLHDEDRADLKRRGLSAETIESFRSIEPGQTLDLAINPKTPGVGFGGRKLLTRTAGYLVPARDLDGNITGFQIRNRAGDKPKYPWLSVSDVTPANLKNGEMPLTVVRGGNNSTLYFCEGILKPTVAAENLGINIIGAAGGLFASSPEQLRECISALLPKTLVLCPDAGAIQNAHVMRSYAALNDELVGMGRELKVLWYEQRTKADSDIDEISREQFEAAKLISWADFVEISKLPAAKPESQPKLKAKPAAETSKRSQEYISRLASITELQSKLSELAPAEIVVNQRYLDKGLFAQHLTPGSVLIPDSPMGTGKTTSCDETINILMERHPNAIAIMTAYRNILLRQSGEHLGFTHWSDCDGNPDLAKFKMISACPDSLSKLADQHFPEGSIFLIDEVVKNLTHIFTSRPLSDGLNRSVVLRSFTKILRKIIECGGYIIAMEDQIPQWVVDCLRELLPAGTPIKVLRNEYKFKVNQKAYLYSKLTPFKTALQSLNMDGQKIVLASDTAAQVDDQYRQMFDRSESFFISAKNSSEPDAQSFASNPQQFLLARSIKVLGYSPTIGAGTSIDDVKGSRFFDVVAGSFSLLTSGDAAQQLARYRTPCPNHIYVQKSARGIGDNDLDIFDPESIRKRWENDALYATGLIGISEYLKGKDESLITALARSLSGEQKDVATINRWRSTIEAVNNFDRLHLRENLIKRLKDRGFEIIEIDDESAKEKTEEFKALKEEAELESAFEIAGLEVPEDMTTDQAREILDTTGHSRTETMQAMKFIKQTEFPQANFDDAEFCLDWVVKNKGKKLNQLRLEWAVRNVESAKAIDRWHLVGKLKKAKALVSGVSMGDIIQISPEADLLSQSGVLEAIDIIGAGNYDNSTDEVVRVGNWARENESLLKQVLRMSIDKKKRSNLDIFNSLARKLGYNPQIEKVAGKDGQRVKQYALNDYCNPDRGHMMKSLTDKFTARLEQKGEQLNGAIIPDSFLDQAAPTPIEPMTRAEMELAALVEQLDREAVPIPPTHGGGAFSQMVERLIDGLELEPSVKIQSIAGFF